MTVMNKERDGLSLLLRFGSEIALCLFVQCFVNRSVCSVSPETKKGLVGKHSNLSLGCENRQEKSCLHLLKDVKQ